MELSASILGIALAVTLGAMSPGPSFLLVARTSLAVSRQDGLAAALGMGVGAVAFAAVALFGLLAVFAAVPWLHLAIKVLGGAYLLYFGWRIWRGAEEPLALPAASHPSRPAQLWRSFALGLFTQVSNPKTAIVYASIFASLLPGEMPPPLLLALPLMVFAIETGWYALVALALSAPAPRARYLAGKAWFDRSAGTILFLLGARLVFEGRQHG